MKADSKVKRDMKGIVEGTPNHLRLSIETRTVDLPDSCSEDAREHVQGTKEKKAGSMDKLKVDFKKGAFTFDSDSDMDADTLRIASSASGGSRSATVRPSPRAGSAASALSSAVSSAGSACESPATNDEAKAELAAARAWMRSGQSTIQREKEKWKAISMAWLENEVREVRAHATRVRQEVLRKAGEVHECRERLEAFAPYVATIDARMEVLKLFVDDPQGFNQKRKDVTDKKQEAPVPDFERVECLRDLKAKAESFGAATGVLSLKEKVGAAKDALKLAKTFLQDVRMAASELANAHKVRSNAAANSERQKVKALAKEAKVQQAEDLTTKLANDQDATAKTLPAGARKAAAQRAAAAAAASPIFQVAANAAEAVDLAEVNGGTLDDVAKALQQTAVGPFKEPLLVRAPRVTSTLMQDSSVQAALSSFVAEFTKDDVYNNVGRASVKCNSLSAAHQALGAFLPPDFKMTVTDDDENAGCKSYVKTTKEAGQDWSNMKNNVARCLMPGFWGMAPNKSFIGTYVTGFPAQRIQLDGARDVLIIPPNVWVKFFEERGKSKVLPFDLGQPECTMHSHALIVQTLSQLSEKEVAELLATRTAEDSRAVRFASLVAGDCLLLPSGCWVAERTAKSMAVGIRQTILPNTLEAAQDVELDLARCPSAASRCMLHVATHKLGQRGGD